MPTKRGLLGGPKGSNKHTTILVTAEPMVAAANRLPEVTRVRPGLIRHRGGGRKFVKFIRLHGAVRMRIGGDGAVQDVTIHSTDHDATIAALQERWDDLYG